MSADKLVCFHLGDQLLGVPIAQVKETLVLRPITRVFLVPRLIAGLVNLRGEVVAVLDLAAMLEGGETGFSDDTRIVITRAGGKTAGLLVDRLAEARSYDPAALAPVPPTVAPEAAALFAGVLTGEGGVPLAVLDAERVLADRRLEAFARKS